MEIARYLSGNVVTVRIELGDFHAESASYTITDRSGQFVLEKTDIDIYYDDTFVEIEVPSKLNGLGTKITKGMRTIELTCKDDCGHVYVLYYSYMLLAAFDLQVPAEALMNARDAQFLAFDTPNVMAYEEANDLHQRRALIESSRRINSLNFNLYEIMGVNDAFNDFNWNNGRVRLKDLSHGEYIPLPTHFLEDVQMAVLLECDDILGGNPVEEARREGILSESVGESTNMYQVGRPAQSRIGTRAYRVLARYVQRSYEIRR